MLAKYGLRVAAKVCLHNCLGQYLKGKADLNTYGNKSQRNKGNQNYTNSHL